MLCIGKLNSFLIKKKKYKTVTCNKFMWTSPPCARINNMIYLFFQRNKVIRNQQKASDYRNDKRMKMQIYKKQKGSKCIHKVNPQHRSYILQLTAIKRSYRLLRGKLWHCLSFRVFVVRFRFSLQRMAHFKPARVIKAIHFVRRCNFHRVPIYPFCNA